MEALIIHGIIGARIYKCLTIASTWPFLRRFALLPSIKMAGYAGR